MALNPNVVVVAPGELITATHHNNVRANLDRLDVANTDTLSRKTRYATVRGGTALSLTAGQTGTMFANLLLPNDPWIKVVHVIAGAYVAVTSGQAQIKVLDYGSNVLSQSVIFAGMSVSGAWFGSCVAGADFYASLTVTCVAGTVSTYADPNTNYLSISSSW